MQRPINQHFRMEFGMHFSTSSSSAKFHHAAPNFIIQRRSYQKNIARKFGTTRSAPHYHPHHSTFFHVFKNRKTGLLATNFSTLFPTIFRFPVLARQSYLCLHPGTHIGSVPARIQATATTPILLLSALAPALLCEPRQFFFNCF